MAWLSHFIRYIGMLRDPDPRSKPETIEGLPPFALRQTVDALVRGGWVKTFEYDQADVWIDYARVDLRNGRAKLKLEWDQESGGSIAGPRAVLDALRVLDPWTHFHTRHS